MSVGKRSIASAQISVIRLRYHAQIVFQRKNLADADPIDRLRIRKDNARRCGVGGYGSVFSGSCVMRAWASSPALDSSLLNAGMGLDGCLQRIIVNYRGSKVHRLFFVGAYHTCTPMHHHIRGSSHNGRRHLN